LVRYVETNIKDGSLEWFIVYLPPCFDKEYFIFQATSDEYRSKILWQKNGYRKPRFLLQSFIDADELLAIAFSTEPK